MLLGNQDKNNSNPGRNIGGASNPWDWMKASNVMKFYLGDAVVTDQTNRSAFNNGYYHPYVWVLSPKAGGLSIYNGLSGSASIANANLAGGLLAESSISGTSTISPTLIGLGYAISALSASGSLSADIVGQVQMASTLLGQGNLTGALGALVSVLSNLTGSGTLTGEGLAATFISGNLTGVGAITVGITGAIHILSDIVASGTLSADTIGNWPMISSLAGNGAATADIDAIGIVLAALTGTASFNITTGTSPATISADISALGDVVTSESIAAAVWSALASEFNQSGTMGERLNDAGAASNPWVELIEGSYTAKDVLKLMAAVLAGKSTIVDNGDGTKTVTFRSIDDADDRIQADIAESQRTDVTLTP